MHGGNRQSDHARMGFEKLVALLRHSYDRGVTFFDMADLYGTHLYLREALRSIPREKVSILTKLWWRYDGPTEPAAEPYRRKVAATALERFRHEVATDYLDIVLLHCVTTPKWVKQLEPYMDALSEAKDKKQVRAVGVSCHNFEAMEVAAECPWVDVVLARINHRGVKMDGTPEDVTRVLRRTKENGKAVIGMKIYGEGQLADQKDQCIRFAQELGLLDAMTVGAETTEQMDETLRLVAKHPAAKVATGT
jgi:aryl-alcohol dehydrogenase-like predicted oxidoreductase